MPQPQTARFALDFTRTKQVAREALNSAGVATPRFNDYLAASGGTINLVHVLPDGNPATGAQPFSGRDGRGPYTYNPDTILQSFADYGMDLPVDYEHQSVAQPQGYAGPIPAAGWMLYLTYYPGEGFYAAIDWTARAAELIAAKEYRYISPNILYIPDRNNPDGGEVVAITGAGLTNNPNLYLQALNKKDPAGGSSSTAEHSTSATTDHNTMLEKLLEALGLPAEATEDQVLEALNAIKAKAATVDTVATELGATEHTAEALTAAAQSRFDKSSDLAAALNRATTAEAELASLKASAHTAKVDAAITAALQAGTITKGQEAHARKLAETDLATFEAFVGGLKPQVPLGELATHAAQVPDLPTLTKQQKEFARMAGLTEEQFAKTLQAQRSTK